VIRDSLRWFVPASLIVGGAALNAADTPSIDPRALTAGAFSTIESGAGAYSMPVPHLTEEQRKVFADGHAQFH
jgi:hypothetical protein